MGTLAAGPRYQHWWQIGINVFYPCSTFVMDLPAWAWGGSYPRAESRPARPGCVSGQCHWQLIQVETSDDSLKKFITNVYPRLPEPDDPLSPLRSPLAIMTVGNLAEQLPTGTYRLGSRWISSSGRWYPRNTHTGCSKDCWRRRRWSPRRTHPWWTHSQQPE